MIEKDWITINIKYANKCINCNEVIPVGSTQLWKKGEGVKHQKCNKNTHKEPLLELKWFDSNIHPYNKTIHITTCQFCGIPLDKTKDLFMTLDRRCCQTCWGIY